MKIDFKKALPIILSVASCVGVIFTGYLSVKGAQKEANAEISNSDESKAKKIFKCYWPAMASGASTIVCIASNGILGARQQASLVAACVALEKGYRGYKDKVNSVISSEQKKQIESITKTKYNSKDEGFDDLAATMDPVLFYFDFGGDVDDNYFETTPIDIIAAESEFNVRLGDTGHASLNTLRECYGLEWKPEYETAGYTMECGYSHVVFSHKRTYITEDGLYAYVITPDVLPMDNCNNPSLNYISD